MRLASISLLVLCLAAISATAQQDIYNNGPSNGNTDAWSISSGFVVSNTFTPNTGPGALITGLAFTAWMSPGDVLTSAEVSITSQEFGGTTFFDSVVNFTQSGCVANQAGFDVCTETGSFEVGLTGTSYWLNLQNAIADNGDPVYWDENSGPSSASRNNLGTIPSESFTVFGGKLEGTPEPGSIVLFGSGILGLAGILRRKLL
jgi:hypothetical protein